MAIYLSEVTFANAHVTPGDDAAVYAAALHDGITSGCTMTSSSATLTIAAGKLIACGRVARVASSQNVTIDTAKSFARCYLKINMAASDNQRCELKVDDADTFTGFDPLTQQDINASGTVYEMPICIMAMSSGLISSIVWKCGPAHGHGLAKQVTLDKDDWSSNLQTLKIDGVTEDTNIVCTYDYSDKTAFLSADIDVIDQGLGWAKFHATVEPTVDVLANLLLL